jgi:hypothetical protein
MINGRQKNKDKICFPGSSYLDDRYCIRLCGPCKTQNIDQITVKPVLLIPAMVFVNFTIAQDSVHNHELSWNINLETYYSFDFNRPADHQKPSFLYNHSRHNEVNINLALASIFYQSERLRARFGLMAGTYPEENLALEPSLLKNIYEATAGVKLSKKKELWLEAGIFSSHIGFETAISKNCWTVTRSLLAENSPYYETGVKGSYSSGNGKWFLSALVLNGWQRIKRADANNTIATGGQVTYTPSQKFSVNSSSFIGNDKPDSARMWRYFHNLYGSLQLSKGLQMIFGFDYGMEQKEKKSPAFNKWFSPVLMIRYQKGEWAIAGRAEYYCDKNGVIIPLVNTQPFQMQGYSLNVDRNFGKTGVFRLEARYFKNSGPYFQRNFNFVTDDFILTSAFLIDLNSVLFSRGRLSPARQGKDNTSNY